jgi:hypothetical protein
MQAGKQDIFNQRFMEHISPEIIKWLLNGDSAIRWQVMRDLLHADASVYSVERSRIAWEGWGRMLLERQDAQGTWGGGLYGPKWTSATYTLLVLRQLGLDPQNTAARKACMILLDKGHYPDGGINYFKSLKHSETCVTGMILALLAYFGIRDERMKTIARFLIDQQMPDGGWNCESFRGAEHSSFHTTVSVLEGLREYEKQFEDCTEDITGTRQAALEFLMLHRFYRSHTTGQVVDQKMTRFPFPTRWRYDVMRVFDFLCEIDASWDPRMKDAAGLIIRKRKADGTWLLYGRYPGRTFFEMEQPGKPSRWNTLRGLRILQWMERKGSGF